jgi:deoxyribodipyrimidine photo-lyase
VFIALNDGTAKAVERRHLHHLVDDEVRANLTHDPHLSATRGPAGVVRRRAPRSVLLTVDSLGDADPALRAHPDLPAVFVFDEPALARLRLSSKRLIFTVETFQDLARRREVIVYRGDPRVIVPGLDAAATSAPVPSYARYAEGAAELHPWPWLVEPHSGSAASFSAWRRASAGVSADDPPADTGRLAGLQRSAPSVPVSAIGGASRDAAGP